MTAVVDRSEFHVYVAFDDAVFGEFEIVVEGLRGTREDDEVFAARPHTAGF
jgi:hypothetical protein